MATKGGEVSAPAENSLDLNGTLGENEYETESDEFHDTWGFNLPELYRLAMKFYKEKEGTAVKLTYRDKLRLISLTKQVSFGKFRPDVSPEVGVLDVVGQDRRQAWQTLTDMPREAAMAEFVRVVDQLCPLFKPYIQAHRAEHEEQQRRRQEEEETRKREEAERQQLEVDAQKLQLNEHNRIQQQESTIRAALNQQTAIQFEQYAEQQCPGNAEQQALLIAQLQEQHFQQYMQQVYQQQLLHQQQQFQQLQVLGSPGGAPASPDTASAAKDGDTTSPNTDEAQPSLPKPGNNIVMTTNALHHSEVLHPGSPLPMPPPQPQQNGVGEDSADGEVEDNSELIPKMPPLVPASMWTRKDIVAFKDTVRKNPDNVVRIGSLATATVRVPTHEDGTCLFWEFATDSYDIGFGVYFEWTVAPSNQVSVHVSESSDEEDLEEGEEGETKGDVEKGPGKKDNRPPTDEIIPVYRRDCHEEVYCGSHMYPGRGVYLLKFDNSYSLWRSKSLYYRVYYTR